MVDYTYTRPLQKTYLGSSFQYLPVEQSSISPLKKKKKRKENVSYPKCSAEMFVVKELFWFNGPSHYTLLT